MCHYKSVPRIFWAVMSSLVTVSVGGMSSTNTVFKSDSLERLMEVAAREKDVFTTFNPRLGAHGSIGVDVTGLGCIGDDFASFKGCVVSLSNESDLIFGLSSLPLGVQGVEFRGGHFDLSAIPPCEGVKYFSARCCGLSVNVTTLCTLFPHPETMILDTRGQDDVDNCLECLMQMKSLRRLELSCYGHKGPLKNGMLRDFLKRMPQLEKCKLSVRCDLKQRERGELKDSKYHTFEISDSIENNSEGVVEVPDFGEYTDVELRLYSPAVRFIEFRPPSGKRDASTKVLKSMTLSLHNVIPSGEERLIDGGELRYSIYIDRSR